MHLARDLFAFRALAFQGIVDNQNKYAFIFKSHAVIAKIKNSTGKKTEVKLKLMLGITRHFFFQKLFNVFGI